MKKNRMTNLTAPIIPQHYDMGNDDDFGSDFEELPRRSNAPSEQSSVPSSISGDFGDASYSLSDFYRNRLGDDTTQQAPARVPPLGLKEEDSLDDLPPLEDPSEPEDHKEPEPEEESNIKPYDIEASLPSNIEFKFFVDKEHFSEYISKNGNATIKGMTAALEAYNATLDDADKIKIPDRSSVRPSKKAGSSEKSIQGKLRVELENLIRNNKIVFIKRTSNQPQTEPDPSGRYEYKIDTKHDKIYDKLTNTIHWQILNQAMREFNERHPAYPLEPSDAIMNDNNKLHEYLSEYIKFVDRDGNELPLNKPLTATEMAGLYVYKVPSSLINNGEIQKDALIRAEKEYNSKHASNPIKIQDIVKENKKNYAKELGKYITFVDENNYELNVSGLIGKLKQLVEPEASTKSEAIEKMPYPLDPRFIDKGNISMTGLGDATKLYHDFRKQKGLPELIITPEIVTRRENYTIF